jgi:hypothetical protein
MLRARGEEVLDYVLDNAEIKSENLVTVGLRSIWNTKESDRVKDLIRSTKPDLMKVDNFFPLLSPSVFDAAKAMGVPTALSIRNYRLICPSANLFREGHVCTTCVGSKVAFAAIQHSICSSPRYLDELCRSLHRCQQLCEAATRRRWVPRGENSREAELYLR